ncbi:MAG: DHH family phosphoesterase [Clostridia bacterium]|nr:DHH family phosphoesterase [Clostridia bacterium]
MDKKLAKIFEPGVRLCFVVLIVFSLYSLTVSLQTGLVQLGISILLIVYYKFGTKKRSENVGKYVENLMFSVDNASKTSLLDFPLPMVIIQVESSEIIWGNETFVDTIGHKDQLYGHQMNELVEGFDTRWLVEGRHECPYDVTIDGKAYKVNGTLVRPVKGERSTFLATLYLTDITELRKLENKYNMTRPVATIIAIDSYDELSKNQTELEKSHLFAQIEKELTTWAEEVNGVIRKLERDRYLFIFENQDLLKYTEGKFSILEKIREIKNTEDIAASVSLGIGKEGENFQELFRNAIVALDMALSRGGDQAVIKSPQGFEFYGGLAKEIEKHTKVKSRVVANSLKQLIAESSNVFVMGHKFSDLDSLGACVGICAAVRSMDKTPYIIVNQRATSATPLIERLLKAEEYEGTLIDYDEAMFHANPDSLLIVVDTNRPDMTEYPDVLTTIPKIALIDHHRRAADYIENTAVSMHEPYASSACELIAELLQYMLPDGVTLERYEAEALLSGIYLDTKGFTVKTGVRTFEAAAQLKQAGADMLEVKHMFYNDFDSYVKKYQIISSADEILPGITAAYTDEVTDRATAAQAADELINIKGIKASFVIFKEKNGVCVSGRSYGQVNVQVILEKIGGGGSLTMAGAQFYGDETPLMVFDMVRDAAKDYLDEQAK